DDEGEVYAELDNDDEGGVYAELDSGVYAELDDDVYSELDDATPFPDQELNRIGKVYAEQI
ncbi:20408_t:CDS:2, partial [Gigaspora margarita]